MDFVSIVPLEPLGTVRSLGTKALDGPPAGCRRSWQEARNEGDTWPPKGEEVEGVEESTRVPPSGPVRDCGHCGFLGAGRRWWSTVTFPGDTLSSPTVRCHHFAGEGAEAQRGGSYLVLLFFLCWKVCARMMLTLGQS